MYLIFSIWNTQYKVFCILVFEILFETYFVFCISNTLYGVFCPALTHIEMSTFPKEKVAQKVFWVKPVWFLHQTLIIFDFKCCMFAPVAELVAGVKNIL